MNLNDKKIFVTGAGGFIGSHLCSELVAIGADVTAMLHYNSRSDWSNLEFLDPKELDSMRVIKGNVEDSSFMNRCIKGHDVVFHLAALIGIPYSYKAPESYVDTNIKGLLNIMNACKDKQKKIRQYSDDLINKALELEGTITGEHGIGLQKKHYLMREHPDNLPVMKAIKRSLDVNNIMNPGKVFDLN